MMNRPLVMLSLLGAVSVSCTPEQDNTSRTASQSGALSSSVSAVIPYAGGEPAWGATTSISS